MYIGIDLGTTGVKTVLFDESGEHISEYNREYPLICSDDHVEQDAELWWQLCCEGIRHVCSDSGCASPKSLSISCQGISFVPVDKSGRTLANAVSWLDRRAEEQARRLIENFGKEDIFKRTGLICTEDYTLPKLMWMKERRPDIFSAAWKFLLPLDFLNFRLCGKAVTDYTNAGASMMYNVRERHWDYDLLDYAGIDESLLPQVGCMGDCLGKILPDTARMLGISSDCLVYLGGQDQKLAAIGSGIESGVYTVSFGTATAVTKLSGDFDASMSAPQFRLNDSKFVSENSVMTTGAALKWLSSEVFGGVSYRDMDILCEQSKPGAGGVVFNTDLSTEASVRGMTLATTRADIVRALYEGVCRDISRCIAPLGKPKLLKVFGGGAKSDIWCSILANEIGVDVAVLKTSETASLGAAVLASEGKLRPAEIRKIIHPDNQ
jgi:xylulokinase